MMRPRRDLLEHEAHVWQVRLGELAGEMPRLHTLLSREEQDRAARIGFEQGRAEFCLSRAVLRLLLESYGVARAEEVVFTYSAREKPALDPVRGCAWLNFRRPQWPVLAPTFSWVGARTT
jgi:phosphopantetheinyl transferase